MHPSELDDDERVSFERAMAIVERLDDEERLALISHAVASSIRYARDRKDFVLEDWARGLLGTVRAHGSKAFHAAAAGIRH